MLKEVEPGEGNASLSERINQLLKRALQMERKARLYEETAQLLSTTPNAKNAVHFRNLISGPGANEPLEARDQAFGMISAAGRGLPD